MTYVHHRHLHHPVRRPLSSVCAIKDDKNFKPNEPGKCTRKHFLHPPDFCFVFGTYALLLPFFAPMLGWFHGIVFPCCCSPTARITPSCAACQSEKVFLPRQNTLCVTMTLHFLRTGHYFFPTFDFFCEEECRVDDLNVT